MSSAFTPKTHFQAHYSKKGNEFITLATEINEGDTFHHPQPDVDDQKTDTDQVKNILQISQLLAYK
jgi:hypothetical protein